MTSRNCLWIALVSVLVLSAARGAEPSATAGQLPDNLRKNLAAATLVFEGEAIAIGRSPGIWSGPAPVYQRVEYRVVRVIKGNVVAAGQAFKVGHLLVALSPTADPNSPKLRESMFHPGSRLVVFARYEHDGWVALNERDGAVPASDALVSTLTAAAK
jgi:hypothetical protein